MFVCLLYRFTSRMITLCIQITYIYTMSSDIELGFESLDYQLRYQIVSAMLSTYSTNTFRPPRAADR